MQRAARRVGAMDQEAEQDADQEVDRSSVDEGDGGGGGEGEDPGARAAAVAEATATTVRATATAVTSRCARVFCMFKDQRVFTGIERIVDDDDCEQFRKLDNAYEPTTSKSHIMTTDEFLFQISLYDGFPDIPCPVFAKQGIDLRSSRARESLRTTPALPTRWGKFPFQVQPTGITVRFGDHVLVPFNVDGMQVVITAEVQAAAPILGVFVAVRLPEPHDDARRQVEELTFPTMLRAGVAAGRVPQWVPEKAFVASEYQVLAVVRGPHWPKPGLKPCPKPNPKPKPKR